MVSGNKGKEMLDCVLAFEKRDQLNGLWNLGQNVTFLKMDWHDNERQVEKIHSPWKNNFYLFIIISLKWRPGLLLNLIAYPIFRILVLLYLIANKYNYNYIIIILIVISFEKL